MNLFGFNFVFFLPVIIFPVIFILAFIIIVFFVIKGSKNIKYDNIGKTIKEELKIKTIKNLCEYCGSDMGNEVECKNCGAKKTKK